MASPEETSPSRGITFPVQTTISSPSFTSVMGTRICEFSVFSHTFSIFRERLRARSPTDFLWVHSSNSSPIPRRNMMEPAVSKSLLASDTITAAASSTSAPSFLFIRQRIPLARNPADRISTKAALTGAGKKNFAVIRSAVLPTSFV